MGDIKGSKARLVLLTGGIASGKTFVSDYLQKKGAIIIDTDVISRAMTNRDNDAGLEALAEIRAHFGEAVFTDQGELDRGRMRELIFNDSQAKKALETILHGRIQAEVQRQIESLEPYQYGVIVVPVIYNTSPYLAICDEVLVVEVPYDLQLQRLIARDNISKEMAEKIISSQISRLDRRQLGSYIIVSQNKEFVERQLDKLHESYSKPQ
ncbi:dephospho-CoA kinase [Ignatzschineria rhizosphaerae]|uniref:Dephospho-CoA kinase n=1 Tax=Ignatzschineria rhizosphaerae TaxID=2923279 RepID=A0ABY3X645_9GAMM|nr:dephospho-CoA kinase [Ignatzschineria rhizosphaerae]UNM96502.1 dephospho-CoA kinase [Ignatzschineria rhizosphaerae]